MKNSKKLLSIILCFIIIVSATVTSFVASAQSVPAFDETKPYVKATSTPVYPGEETTLTFEIGNNASTTTHKGFWAMRHTLSFDSSVISFVEGETNEYGKFPVFAAGEKFENLLISPISADNEFVFLYTNSLGNIVNNTNNGVLFTIKFKVSEDAQPGTYYFEYKDYKDSNVIDIANNSVAFTYNQPAITVLGEETEPSSTEPSSTEPSSTEPSSTEPSSTEPSSTEPSSTEPSSTEPSSTEPISTEPSSTEPSSTEPSSTEPSSTEPSSTEPSSTENPKDPSGDDNFPTVTEPTEST
ncbi:MAG: hypothetical protein IIU65_03445, partial [Clostridia bacterium]|nr:hypothetical protein [Clostridia bacterium]